MRIFVLVLLLLTGCTQAQPELRQTKEVQTSIPYSDEELIKSANDQIEDEAYYVDAITMQSDGEVWFSLKNKDLNKQYVFKYKGNELVLDRLVDNVD
ncbi:hypothetical protein DWY01_02115 [Eubacterium sp. AF22-8LB]|uniref:hypothetical protein n=1 Tax=Eubacterium sp. AF22-8LB TaxID=2292232 RepID=UPI000E47414B|nr:hypothetical protein [Eubacterium sp. AF22-8LB]RGS32186.1 hypothetical protein DWY01_02115 [Eubacterium sp. AF22-8LB]